MVPDHTGGAHPTTSGLRSSHCQVLALPLTHSPEGGQSVVPARSHRGCPPHDFWAYVDVPVNVACCVLTGAMWVAVALQWEGMPPISPQTGPRGRRQ